MKLRVVRRRAVNSAHRPVLYLYGENGYIGSLFCNDEQAEALVAGLVAVGNGLETEVIEGPMLQPTSS